MAGHDGAFPVTLLFYCMGFFLGISTGFLGGRDNEGIIVAAQTAMLLVHGGAWGRNCI